MQYKAVIIIFLIAQLGFSQQYDSVIVEKDSIDSNNEVYKIGNVHVLDYEIIENGIKKKLKENSRNGFELVPTDSDSIGVKKIHLLIKPSIKSKRTNENQTQISYLEEPSFASYSSTGAVDNTSNVWIHPIRNGFFMALETCPFPFIKKPIEIGAEWKDAMLIGESWGNKLWGVWKDELLLNYTYKVTRKEMVNTVMGDVECFVVESTAESTLGSTKLTSYYSDIYGFIRLEYSLLTDIKVNIWVIDILEGKEFNDTMTFFKTREYIKSK